MHTWLSYLLKEVYTEGGHLDWQQESIIALHIISHQLQISLSQIVLLKRSLISDFQSPNFLKIHKHWSYFSMEIGMDIYSL